MIQPPLSTDRVRRERGRVVGRLVRLFGDLDLAEDAFQDALVAAMKTWPESGTPENPGAWLMTAAKHRALDMRKHLGRVQSKHELLRHSDGEHADPPDPFEVVADDQLRLIFTCCHPALSQEAQVALTLKVIAGLSIEEIARAFLCEEGAMRQRIVRAKKLIAERAIAYAVPERRDLPARVNAVLAVLYLIFNEGYLARDGALMRLDLQAEALRLTRWLCDLMPNEAEAFGLFALMAFSSARAPTRTDAGGTLLLLSEQDRARWDRALIREGLFALQRTRTLQGGGAYALQAELSACHARASRYEDTDWQRILAIYDVLLQVQPTAVVALNRAVAVSMAVGPREALGALVALEQPLASYHLFYAIRADFLRQLGEDARADYEQALQLATNDSERAFLRNRLAALEG